MQWWELLVVIPSDRKDLPLHSETSCHDSTGFNTTTCWGRASVNCEIENRGRIGEVKFWLNFLLSHRAFLIPQRRWIRCMPIISPLFFYLRGVQRETVLFKTWKKRRNNAAHKSREVTFGTYARGNIHHMEWFSRHKPSSDMGKTAHACKRYDRWVVTADKMHHAQLQGRSFFLVVLSFSYLGFQGPVSDLPNASCPFRRHSGLRSQAEQANSGKLHNSASMFRWQMTDIISCCKHPLVPDLGLLSAGIYQSSA